MVETTTKQGKQAKPAQNEQPVAVPRKRAESPQAYYERITQRDDVRQLLAKLAKL